MRSKKTKKVEVSKKTQKKKAFKDDVKKVILKAAEVVTSKIKKPKKKTSISRHSKTIIPKASSKHEDIEAKILKEEEEERV